VGSGAGWDGTAEMYDYDKIVIGILKDERRST
jgi:hypothetical protein